MEDPQQQSGFGAMDMFMAGAGVSVMAQAFDPDRQTMKGILAQKSLTGTNFVVPYTNLLYGTANKAFDMLGEEAGSFFSSFSMPENLKKGMNLGDSNFVFRSISSEAAKEEGLRSGLSLYRQSGYNKDMFKAGAFDDLKNMKRKEVRDFFAKNLDFENKGDDILKGFFNTTKLDFEDMERVSDALHKGGVLKESQKVEFIKDMSEMVGDKIRDNDSFQKLSAKYGLGTMDNFVSVIGKNVGGEFTEKVTKKFASSFLLKTAVGSLWKAADIAGWAVLAFEAADWISDKSYEKRFAGRTNKDHLKFLSNPVYDYAKNNNINSMMQSTDDLNKMLTLENTAERYFPALDKY